MRFRQRSQAPRGESESLPRLAGAGVRTPAPTCPESRQPRLPTTLDGPAHHDSHHEHTHSDHEVSARGSDSPRSTGPTQGSTELPRELMSEAKAGDMQMGLRGLSARLPRLLSALRRPGLPWWPRVNIGLALKPRCIQKQLVFPVHATQAGTGPD